MTVQELTLGLLLFLLPAAVLVFRGHRLRYSAENFGVFTAHRSSLAAMPVADRYEAARYPATQAPYFDGVVVPAARGAGHLRAAATTARNAGACLVVLASGRTSAPEVETLLAGIGLAPHRYLVLDFGELVGGSIFPMRTLEHPFADRTSDLSQKRNAGLIIAHVMGWRSVLFVDDDVQPMEQTDLKDAAALLAGADRGGVTRHLVGWAITEFRDFSAVGHARAHGTDAQASFAGGGAMALSCDPMPPFFPPVYNEDMVLCLEILRNDPAAACVVGTMTQLEHDPFGDPRRGATQEFGEVLVEGMLEKPKLDEAVQPDFWSSVVEERRAMLRQLSARLVELGVQDGARVVQLALETHNDDWPDLLAGFVADWHRDLALWRDALSALPRTNRLDQAAAILARSFERRARPNVDQAAAR